MTDPNFDWLKYARDQKHKAAELQMEASKALANADYAEAMHKAEQYGSGAKSTGPVSPAATSTPSDGKPHCADCGLEITPSKDNKYSAKQKADWSIKDYGAIYCYKCRDNHTKKPRS